MLMAFSLIPGVYPLTAIFPVNHPVNKHLLKTHRHHDLKGFILSLFQHVLPDRGEEI